MSLVIIEATNLRTGKRHVVGVAHKKTSQDLGLMLTVCPWCGEPILWWKEAQES